MKPATAAVLLAAAATGAVAFVLYRRQQEADAAATVAAGLTAAPAPVQVGQQQPPEPSGLDALRARLPGELGAAERVLSTVSSATTALTGDKNLGALAYVFPVYAPTMVAYDWLKDHAPGAVGDAAKWTGHAVADAVDAVGDFFGGIF